MTGSADFLVHVASTVNGPGALAVIPSTGTAFGTDANWTAGSPAPDANATGYHVGDFTGDGRDDFLVHVASSVNGPGALAVLLSTGTAFGTDANWAAGQVGFGPAANWTAGSPAPDGAATGYFVGDFDGL